MREQKQFIAKIRNKAGTGLHKRGREQIDRIVACAKEILLTEGYAALTMRTVATKVDISPGTLTYYFRRKEDLLRSLFESFLEDHGRLVASKHEEAPKDKEAPYHALVDTLIEEARDSFVRAFFYNLWAVSTHEPFVRLLRKEGYLLMLNEAESVIRLARPNLSAAEARKKAFVFCALMEGLAVMMGSHPTQIRAAAGFENVLRAQTKFLLD